MARPSRFVSLERSLPFKCVAAELFGEGKGEWLSEEETRYISGCVPRRITEFAAGRACARFALGQLGLPTRTIPVLPDRRPRWPRSVVGSISHTNGYCTALVAAKSTIRSVGVDCETVGAITSDLWPIVYTIAEREWLCALSRHRQAIGAALLFAAKESAFKCQFALTGDWWEFHDVEITAELPPESNNFSARCLRDKHKDLPMAMHGVSLLRDQFIVTANWISHTAASPVHALQE